MKIKSNVILNALGKLCPQPIIDTAKMIKKMQEGEILEILSDDWGMKQDLPAWCRSTGHVLIRMDEEKKLIRSFVQKSIR